MGVNATFGGSLVTIHNAFKINQTSIEVKNNEIATGHKDKGAMNTHDFARLLKADDEIADSTTSMDINKQEFPKLELQDSIMQQVKDITDEIISLNMRKENGTSSMSDIASFNQEIASKIDIIKDITSDLEKISYKDSRHDYAKAGIGQDEVGVIIGKLENGDYLGAGDAARSTHAQIGSSMDRIDVTNNALEAKYNAAESLRSKIEDISPEETIMEIKQLQLQHEAMVKMTQIIFEMMHTIIDIKK